MFGALVTTGLYPAGALREQQMELAKRLMLSVAGSLKHSQTLQMREHQLRLTNEMLELRSIADHQFDSPLTMIEEFLLRLTEKAAAQRAALFSGLKPVSSYVRVSAGSGVR